MMAEEEKGRQRGLRLISDLSCILDSNPSIDELGFVHPIQLESLHCTANLSPDHERPFFMKTKKKLKGQEEFTDSLEQSEDYSQENEGQELDTEQPGTNPDLNSRIDIGRNDRTLAYDTSAFWCAHHKLAIAFPCLAPIFEVAKAKFLLNRKEYTELIEEAKGPSYSIGSSLGPDFLNNNMIFLDETASERKALLEKNLMRYTRALVIVNSDYASAWNARKNVNLSATDILPGFRNFKWLKQILSSWEVNEEILRAELLLAGLVLSYGPKSEESWAYRRWIIKRMTLGGLDLDITDSVLEDDSKLVELIAGRSTMNYRAWRHRCWLVTHMTVKQVLAELQSTKLWAQAHLADNCCFHYRRCLLLGILQAVEVSSGITTKNRPFTDSRAQASLCTVFSEDPQILARLWEEELSWNKELVRLYIGREALWIHRRFLMWGFGHSTKCFQSSSVPIIFTRGGSIAPLAGGESDLTERATEIASRELQFADSCISACSSDLMEDASRQLEFAAAYKLWVLSLRLAENGISENGHPQTALLDLNTVELLLKDVTPHRQGLWNGLVPKILQLSMPDRFADGEQAVVHIEVVK